MASAQKEEDQADSCGGGIFQLFGEDLVSIEVGTEDSTKRFMVHKALLCKKIEYLDNMFNSTFKEGIEQKAAFPDDDIEAWALLIEWLYRDRTLTRQYTAKSADAARIESLKLLKVVCLTEKYLIDELADFGVDTILHNYKFHNLVLETEAIKYGYSNTSEGSTLRYLLSCFAAYMYSWPQLKDDQTKLQVIAQRQPDLALDILDVLAEHASKGGKLELLNPNLAPPCDFHQHAADVPCPYAKTTST